MHAGPILLAVLLGSPAQGPADALLRLAPADSGATLVVEDLRIRAPEALDSPLARRLLALPAARSLRASPRFADLRRAGADIERALGVDLPTIRDRLLGTAVVLALIPAEGAPGGLLLARVSDRPLLDRLVKAANDAERAPGGPLLRVEARDHRGITYSVRTFRPGTKPAEAYAILPGDIFAWSGTEGLIRGAIDRHLDGGPGLAGEPRFARVRKELPGRSLASLYVDPRFVERASAATPAGPPQGERVAAAMRRYLGAMEYAGLAIEWRDGPTLHAFEALDPSKLDDPLRRAGAAPGSSTALRGRIPAGAVAVASTGVDWAAWVEMLATTLEPADAPKLDALLVVARGLLLGRDARAEILPGIGPGLVAYLGAAEAGLWPIVVGFEVRPEVAGAIDNALRTALAVAALAGADGKPGRVVDEDLGGVRATRLVGGSRSLAYAMGPGVLALGNDPAAASAFANAGGEGPPLESLRRERFPTARTYAAVDIAALARWAGPRRAALASRVGAEAEDVDSVLGVAGLLRAAYFAGEVGPGYAWVRRSAGLVGRP